MKFGIYIKIGAVKGGGGYTFGTSLLESLKNIRPNHEIIILYSHGGLTASMPIGQYFANEAVASVTIFSKIAGIILKIRNLLVKLIRRSALVYACCPYSLKRLIFYSLDHQIKKNRIDLLWYLSPSNEFVRVPYIVPIWDLEPLLQPYFPEFFNYSETEKEWLKSLNQSQTLFRRALYVITGTDFLKKKLAFLYNIPEDRIRVIPFPVPSFVENVEDPGKIGEMITAITVKPFLFYPAQFWAHKNHVTLLLALKILQEKHSLDFNLILTGSEQGNLSFIKQTVHDLGLETRVHFPGFVSQAEILYLYQHAIALVFPTFFGPDNLPPLEAFALGCPVIASRLPGVEEQLEDAAILVNPRDEDGFAEAIINLVSDSDLRSTLIRRGHAIAKKWNAMDYLKKILDIADDFERIKRNWQS